MRTEQREEAVTRDMTASYLQITISVDPDESEATYAVTTYGASTPGAVTYAGSTHTN